MPPSRRKYYKQQKAKTELPAELWDRVKAGDLSARNEVIAYYQFLVEATASVISYRLPSFVSVDELTSYGQMGLIRAITTFNPEVGTFRRYASGIIYGSIIDELRYQDWVPRNLRRDHKLISLAKDELQADSVSDPSNRDIAEHLGWEEDKVDSVHLRIERSQMLSVDQVSPFIPDHSGLNVTESLGEGRYYLSKFVEIFDSLDEDDQVIIACRYYLNLPWVVVQTYLPGMSLNAIKERHNEITEYIYHRMMNYLEVRD